MDTIFTLTALIGGTVLVFQFVLMLLGIGDDGADLAGSGDVSSGADLGGDAAGGDLAGEHPSWNEAADADLGHPGAPWFYEMLSLRTLSAAVTFFGLAGKTALAYGYSATGAAVLASVVGLAAMYIVYWLFKQLYKLQQSGTENIRNALGAQAVVYVPIPGNRAGAGKVTFRLQNRLVEYLAVTEDEHRLTTGEKVVIVAIVSPDTVRVARAAAPAPEMAPSSSMP